MGGGDKTYHTADVVSTTTAVFVVWLKPSYINSGAWEVS